MVDLEILEAHGLTQENLQKWLSGNPLMWPRAKNAEGSTSGQPLDEAQSMRVAMWNRMRSRVQEGMNRNFKDYKVYHALDLAWDTPFRQISATLLRAFIESGPTEEEVTKRLEEWGLSHMMTQEVDRRTGQATGKKTFNLPIFFFIFVPLVKAYVTIRWAKIMNDRTLIPFFKFDPAKLTTPNKVRCEVLTDRTQIMSNQYGYYDVMKQAVLKMLHYGFCFQFPKEGWHSESTRKYADEVDVKLAELNSTENPPSVGDEITVTSREGLRYHHPHPTRCFRDLAHGADTYNYDSGAEFAGYWQIRRYRSLIDSGFWNTDAISIGPNSLVIDQRTFFATVYSACTLQMPTLPKATTATDGTTLLAQVGAGIGDLDREKELAYLFYGTDHYDQGVLVTEYFEKLIPNQNGLGDYDCPVWFRFVVAGDNSTYLYAEPLPYAPTIYYGYDCDESRTNNASMSLEVLPFQDHFSQTLSQIILTAKQNLANMTLIDEDVLSEEAKTTLLNLGEKQFRFLNVLGFSGRKAARGQNKVVDAIQSHSLPKGNVAELTSVLKTILDVLERVLQMSSQEVAQSASHEQTREEVRNIDQAKNTRVMFTSRPVDIAKGAWKRQIYNGLMAYADQSFFAHIPAEMPLNRKVLETMGFTVADEEHMINPGVGKDTHVRVHVKDIRKTAIDMWMLVEDRDGDDRIRDDKIAVAMSQIVLNLMNNPMTAQAIGAEQAIELANQIAQLAGLPRDFKLRNMAPPVSPEQQQAEAQQQLQALAQQVTQNVMQTMSQEMKPLLDHEKDQDKDIALIMKALGVNLPQVPNPAAENDTAQPTPAIAGPS